MTFYYWSSSSAPDLQARLQEFVGGYWYNCASTIGTNVGSMTAPYTLSCNTNAGATSVRMLILNYGTGGIGYDEIAFYVR